MRFRRTPSARQHSVVYLIRHLPIGQRPMLTPKPRDIKYTCVYAFAHIQFTNKDLISRLPAARYVLCAFATRRFSVPQYIHFSSRTSFEKESAMDFISRDEEITLNVGGHRFQTTAGVLCRDRFSLLASICKTAPPFSKDEDGAFFFERDW